MSKAIRVFDYLNHPYDEVRFLLRSDASKVFREATKVAAMRAKNVASELHINIAGFEIGTDISISVKSIKDHPKKIMSPAKTSMELEWEATNLPNLFPLMEAELLIYPLTSTETQLVLEGEYNPPLGYLGRVIDDAIGHHIAEATVHQFIKDVSVYLRKKIKEE